MKNIARTLVPVIAIAAISLASTSQARSWEHHRGGNWGGWGHHGGDWDDYGGLSFSLGYSPYYYSGYYDYSPGYYYDYYSYPSYSYGYYPYSYGYYGY